MQRRSAGGAGPGRGQAALILGAALLLLIIGGLVAVWWASGDEAAPGDDGETARVTRVVDGDTLVIEIDGREDRVRYIGVDTPETVAPGRPVECYGREASARNKELVEGKTIRLVRDVSDRDRFDRLLRYVYVGDTFVNAELIRGGYATVATFPPDVREIDRLRGIEREAREARRGLWGACPK